MAGTKEDPFLDTIAVCDICLDLDQSHLRRQWRRFGRLPAMDVPYGFTLSKLAESAESRGCKGCAALDASALLIGSENQIDFQNARLEFVKEGGLEGLSLTLTTLYPVLAAEKDWQKAKDAEELKTYFMAGPGLLTEFVTGPSEKSPDRIKEFRISSPGYEIFHPKRDDGTLTSKKLESAIQTRPSQCGDTGSDEAVAWVQAQLEKCVSTHVECNVHDPDDWKLPTRVLDLGQDLSLLAADPRVYVTNGSEKADYVCLSHCWGPPDKTPLETTPNTLEASQQRIPWDQLNATFREAIIFTRKLGVRYLWIDSLCIVQGDAQDWAREAKRMAGVYENARLTLAAASSKNGHEGLFRMVKRETVVTRDNKEEDEPSEKVAIRLLPDPAFFAYDRTSGFHHPDRVSPLLKRAWVFQERALSRRMLYFTPLELVLECRCGCASESGQPYWSETPLKHRFRAAYRTELDYKAKVAEERDEHVEDEQEDDNLALLWRSLVEDFTHLGLTRTSDTLPAMTGLAQRILRARNFGFNPDEEHQATYLAGLWRQTLLDDMLWERVRRSPEGRVNVAVPSWSWARSDCSKQFVRHYQLAYLCDVFDAWCDPLLESRFLGVGERGGQVTLNGFLIPARYKEPWLVIDENPRVSYNVKEDYDWDSGEEPYGFDAGSDGREKEEKHKPDVIPDGERLFVLPVVLARDDSGAGGYGANVHALVLRPRGDVTGRFRRVGIFWTSLLHMRHHDYILEGSDILQRELQRHIAYGESILGEDGLCHEPKDALDPPAKGEDTMAFKEHRNAASHTYTVIAGRRGADTDGFPFYYGLKHQEVLKDQLKEEQGRLREWQRRNETGDIQEHPRLAVIIT